MRRHCGTTCSRETENDSAGDAVGKFIVFTFLVLGVVFYEMSGGSDFEPELRAPIAVAKTELPAAPAPIEPQVARADTSSLIEIPRPERQESATPVVERVAFTAPLPAGEVLITPAPEPAAVETVETVPVIEQTPVVDVRAVAGEWVNMRSGPSTDFRVLDTLPRGTEAEVIEVNGDGWARIVIMQTGQEGWMAERLLSNL